MFISTSNDGAKFSAGWAFLPAPRQSNLQTNSLTDLLTDLLADWMTILTNCAKASRARSNLRRTIDLRHEGCTAPVAARQESQHARKVSGLGFRPSSCVPRNVCPHTRIPTLAGKPGRS